MQTDATECRSRPRRATGGRSRRLLRWLLQRVLLPWLAFVALAMLAVVAWAVYAPSRPDAALRAALEAPEDHAAHAHFAHGTGFFISPDGYVLTARHVVDHCSMLAGRDEAGTVFPLALLDGHQRADIALLRATTAALHPYLALSRGRYSVDRMTPMVATGIPGLGVRQWGHEPIRSIALTGGTYDDSSHLLISDYDISLRGDLHGASGGPLTLRGDIAIALLKGEETVTTKPAITPGHRHQYLTFTTLDGYINAMSPQIRDHVYGADPALRAAPAAAMLNIWCLSNQPS